jgi:hypothetical protein
MGRGRHARDVFETASFGFDDYLQTVGSDPTLGSSGLGLRVPALAGVRYLFLGARADLDAGDAVVGFRQLLTIAEPTNNSEEERTVPPLVPVERPVVTPEWHPPDAYTSWHLMAEPKAPAGARAVGPFDQESFVFEDSNSPALLYETAAFGGVPTAPGYLGLTAYAPPVMRGTSLVTLRDIRAPWHKVTPLRYEVQRPTTVRFYVACLQTDPATRFNLVLTPSDFTIAGLVPEDNYAQAFPGYQYWRLAVSLLVARDRRKPRRPPA